MSASRTIADTINQTVAAAFRHRALGSLYQSSGVRPEGLTIYSSLHFIHEAKEGWHFSSGTHCSLGSSMPASLLSIPAASTQG